MFWYGKSSKRFQNIIFLGQQAVIGTCASICRIIFKYIDTIIYFFNILKNECMSSIYLKTSSKNIFILHHWISITNIFFKIFQTLRWHALFPGRNFTASNGLGKKITWIQGIFSLRVVGCCEDMPCFREGISQHPTAWNKKDNLDPG